MAHFSPQLVIKSPQIILIERVKIDNLNVDPRRLAEAGRHAIPDVNDHLRPRLRGLGLYRLHTSIQPSIFAAVKPLVGRVSA